MSRSVWEGERVRLRAVEATDAEVHFRWDQDDDMARRLDRIYFPRSRELARRWAEETAARKPTDDSFHFEIENRTADVVGAIATHDCDRRTGTFSYGVAVRPEHQRQGYAAEAIQLVLRYFFRELRYQKVTVHIYAFNEPSVWLHEQLGFVQEGRLRRLVYTDGRHWDVLVYGMTAEEFEARHGGQRALG